MIENETLPKQLRRLADAIERTGVKQEHANVDLRIHFVDSIEDLRKARNLVDAVEASEADGTCWIHGMFSGEIRMCAFYRTGLLGTVKTVTVEDTDLTILDSEAESL